MQLNIFPYTYRTELDKQVTQQVLQAAVQRENMIDALRNSNYQYTVNLNSTKKSIRESTYAAFGGGGFIIGLIGGIFVCVAKGDAIDSKINFSNSLGSAFAFWFMFGFIGAVLGIILCVLVVAAQKRLNRSIDDRIASANCSTNQQITIEIQRYEGMAAQIKNEADKRYQLYLDEFNAEAGKMSMRFAGSPLSVEVIEWMTSGFCRMIDGADRSKHIQQINIPFMFRTYRNKIECILGTYDFKIKRCEELQTPLDQAALTRALASAIQRNVSMKYPRDASGTNAVLNISYTYESNNAIATIIYEASNNYYEEVHSW